MSGTNGTGNGREMEFTLPIGYMNGDSVLRRHGSLRKMTGRDEAILADKANQRNGGKLVTELIHSCVTKFEGEEALTKQDIASWYSADRNYLLLRLRAFTFGPELEARYTCPSCGDKIDVVENLDELPVKSLPEGEALEDVQVELEDGYWDTENRRHASLTLTLPRGIDESAVAPIIRKNPSLGKNALLARCIKSFGDIPMRRVEALGPKLFADLTLTDRRLIDKALNRAAPGVDLLRELDCMSCGEQIKTNLDMTHFLALD
jgi:predicted RNA-binding Zn-ribbon protein involved in translation (DUF1610 family)